MASDKSMRDLGNHKKGNSLDDLGGVRKLDISGELLELEMMLKKLQVPTKHPDQPAAPKSGESRTPFSSPRGK